MSDKTNTEYGIAVKKAKVIFKKKMQDYGASWRMLRISSLTDQIFIKAQRIRSIDQKGISLVGEGIEPEFIGILNYSLIALIQLELGELEIPENPKDIEQFSTDKAFDLYNKYAKLAHELMEEKNHDYDEAWRQMRIGSFTDLILTKLMRIKEIEDNEGETLISEGIDANYFDIINYAIFALIKLDEKVNC